MNPNVVFSYDLQKDADNVIIGLNTVRQGRNPESELAAMIRQLGPEPDRSSLVEYLKKRWSGREKLITLLLKELQEHWDENVSESYFPVLKEKMDLDYSIVPEIPGYASTRRGTGYDSKAPWFAISIHGGTLDNTAASMHEIMHIFFHRRWWDFCLQAGLPDKNVWDVKEAVTVLLNAWFRPLLLSPDLGYAEHSDLRHEILMRNRAGDDFQKILLFACDYMKANKEKGPSWIA